MTKIRFKKEWFYPISMNTLLENQFEDLLICNSDMFRNGCLIAPFKKTIYSADGSAKADLALVDREYAEWFVVEVEMTRHDLYGHVLPQVRTLRDGYYGPDEADYISDRIAELDREKTREMLRGRRPKIIVIADRKHEAWSEALSGADINLITMDIYKSDLNQYMFAIDGGLPQRADNLISYCTLDPMLPRQMKVESPTALHVDHGDPVTVIWDGSAIEWIRMDIANACYLRTRARIDLRQGVRYALLRSEDGPWTLKSAGKAR